MHKTGFVLSCIMLVIPTASICFNYDNEIIYKHRSYDNYSDYKPTPLIVKTSYAQSFQQSYKPDLYALPILAPAFSIVGSSAIIAAPVAPIIVAAATVGSLGYGVYHACKEIKERIRKQHSDERDAVTIPNNTQPTGCGNRTPPNTKPVQGCGSPTVKNNSIPVGCGNQRPCKKPNITGCGDTVPIKTPQTTGCGSTKAINGTIVEIAINNETIVKEPEKPAIPYSHDWMKRFVTASESTEKLAAHHGEEIQCIIDSYADECKKIGLPVPDIETFQHVESGHMEGGSRLVYRGKKLRSVFNKDENWIQLGIETWEKGKLIEPGVKEYDFGRTIGKSLETGEDISVVRIVTKPEIWRTIYPLE